MRHSNQRLLETSLNGGDFNEVARLASDCDEHGVPRVDFNKVGNYERTALEHLIVFHPGENFIELFQFIATLKNAYGNPIIDFNQNGSHGISLLYKILDRSVTEKMSDGAVQRYASIYLFDKNKLRSVMASSTPLIPDLSNLIIDYVGFDDGSQISDLRKRLAGPVKLVLLDTLLDMRDVGGQPVMQADLNDSNIPMLHRVVRSTQTKTDVQVMLRLLDLRNRDGSRTFYVNEFRHWNETVLDDVYSSLRGGHFIGPIGPGKKRDALTQIQTVLIQSGAKQFRDLSDEDRQFNTQRLSTIETRRNAYQFHSAQASAGKVQIYRRADQKAESKELEAGAILVFKKVTRFGQPLWHYRGSFEYGEALQTLPQSIQQKLDEENHVDLGALERFIKKDSALRHARTAMVNQDAQSIHDVDVARASRDSYNLLKARYPLYENQEVKVEDVIPDSKAKDRSGVSSDAAWALQRILSEKVPHRDGETGLSLEDALKLVICGSNDKKSIPVNEQNNASAFIATRKRALIEKLAEIATQYRQNETCFMGTFRMLILSLNGAHQDVDIPTAKAGVAGIVIPMLRTWAGERLAEPDIDINTQRDILSQWSNSDNRIFQQFKDLCRDYLKNKLDQSLGKILTPENKEAWLSAFLEGDDAPYPHCYDEVAAKSCPTKLAKLLRKVYSLDMEMDDSEQYKSAVGQIKSHIKEVYSLRHVGQTYDDDLQWLQEKFDFEAFDYLRKLECQLSRKIEGSPKENPIDKKWYEYVRSAYIPLKGLGQIRDHCLELDRILKIYGASSAEEVKLETDSFDAIIAKKIQDRLCRADDIPALVADIKKLEEILILCTDNMSFAIEGSHEVIDRVRSLISVRQAELLNQEEPLQETHQECQRIKQDLQMMKESHDMFSGDHNENITGIKNFIGKCLPVADDFNELNFSGVVELYKVRRALYGEGVKLCDGIVSTMGNMSKVVQDITKSVLSGMLRSDVAADEITASIKRLKSLLENSFLPLLEFNSDCPKSKFVNEYLLKQLDTWYSKNKPHEFEAFVARLTQEKQVLFDLLGQDDKTGSLAPLTSYQSSSQEKMTIAQDAIFSGKMILSLVGDQSIRDNFKNYGEEKFIRCEAKIVPHRDLKLRRAFKTVGFCLLVVLSIPIVTLIFTGPVVIPSLIRRMKVRDINPSEGKVQYAKVKDAIFSESRIKCGASDNQSESKGELGSGTSYGTFSQQ